MSLVVTSLRRGRPLYRALAQLIFFCILVAYGGLIVVIFLRVDAPYKALMLFYPSLAVILGAAVLEGTVGGRKLFRRVAADYYSEKERHDAGADDRCAANSLPLYLLYPRPADIIKWVFIPVMVVLLAGLGDGFDLRWRTVWAIVFGTVIFELLLYAARYQINDIRDYDRDVGHTAAEYRGRLPRGRTHAERRGIVATSLLVAVYRVLLTFALVLILVPSGLVEVVIIAVLVVFSTAVYELLKASSRRCQGSTQREVDDVIDPRQFRSPSVWGIWLWVGTGYAIRGGVTWAIADHLDAAPALDVVTASLAFLFILGVLFVTEMWALETTSLLIRTPVRPGEARVDTRALEKPHLLALLSFLRAGRSWRLRLGRLPPSEDQPAAPAQALEVLPVMPVAGYSGPDIGDDPRVHAATTAEAACRPTRDLVLAWRSSVGAVWHIALAGALVAGIAVAVATDGDAAGGVVALSLAPIATIALVASVALTATLTRLVLAVALAVATVVATIAVGRPWEAAVAIVAVVGLDAWFRMSSYEAMVTGTKKATDALAAAPMVVARTVLGDSSQYFEWPAPAQKPDHSCAPEPVPDPVTGLASYLRRPRVTAD